MSERERVKCVWESRELTGEEETFRVDCAEEEA
jgi:hypothetical protein